MAPGRPGDIKEVCLSGFTLFRQKYLLGRTKGRLLEKREKEKLKGNRSEDRRLSNRNAADSACGPSR